MAGNVMILLSFSFFVVCQVQSSNAYPTGAVTSACGDMTPSHGPSSQTSVSPYTISVSPAFYQPGQQMNVTILSNTGSPALKGILLQARRTGTDQIIGVWSLEGTTSFRTLACNGANSAVTHTTNGDKPATFQLNWTPPNVNGFDIYVTATFVQTRPVFWVAQRTSDIQDACNAIGANLCGANGNCESLIGGGINCICEEGYTGIQCTSPCNSDPCVNGGTCTYIAGDTTFTCSCPSPFGGPICQTGTTTETTQGTTPGTTPRTTPRTTPGLAQPQIQPMSSVQPLTRGQRVALDCTVTNANMDENIEWYHDGDVISFGQSLLRDREGAYTLQVTQEKGVPSTYHWIITIANADIARDEGSWSCRFAGPPVQEVVTDLLVIVDPCSSTPCQNGGQCNAADDFSSFTCQCVSPYTGTTCNQSPCDSNPCFNGGTCGITATGYMCNCPPTHTGERCETDVTPDCTNSLPCQNGGTCALVQASYQCQCTPLFEGAQCGLDITDCRLQANSCVNGGTCQSQAGIYACVCPEFFQLPRCIVELTGCLRDPCQNGGTCAFNENGDPVCLCPGEYVGSQCETALTCDSSPCQNGGTCLESGTAGSDGFLCLCPTGYTGLSCETEKCTASPCRNGGTCIDETTGFICQCPGGYSGDRCDTPDSVRPCDNFPCGNGATCLAIGTGDGQSYLCICTPGSTPQPNCEVQACSLTPCENGGTCSGDANSYTCQCPAGYTGVNCENTVQACSPSPCQNDGTCSGDANSYTCQCPVGYTGVNCENTDITDCRSPGNSCVNGGTCQSLAGIYACVCPEFFQLPRCIVELRGCLRYPCQNGGTCAFKEDVDPVCECPVWYAGSQCEIALTCDSSPCQNGGTCFESGTAGSGGFLCLCPTGYTGLSCETEKCTASPCRNGGTCMDETTVFNCQCPAGYIGDRCNISVQACISSPCQNGGTCSGDANGYTCQCPVGFDGVNCENTDSASPCDSSPCGGNGATCLEEGGGQSYFCICPAGSTPQPNCEVQACSSSPCQNGGTCSGDANGYTCQCLVGFDGVNCENTAIPCESSPCQNDGICFGSGSGAGYLCQCPTGYTGLNCETEICTASTCHNGGTCINEITGFNCQCPAGYIGDRCEIPVTTSTLCNHSPCQNGGTCNQRSDTAYTCACLATYVGTNCDIPAPCNPRPCQNGGTCTVTGLESYSCACPPLYTGIKCQTLGAACSPLIFLNASFPDGREGDVVDSSETCPIYTTSGGTPIGRAECVQNTASGELAWNITMYLNDCGPLRETNEVVDEIIEKGVTNETVIEVLEVVVVVTDMELDEGNIVNIANIISNSTALQSGDPGITTLTATIISNFAEKDKDELSAVEENTGAITQILESFEEQLNNLDISDGQSYTALEMNVAVQVTSVEPADFSSGLTVSASSTSSDLRQTDITLNEGDSIVQEEILTGTRVSIPSSVLNDLSSEDGSESGVRLALTVFSTSSLFTSQHIRGTNAGQSSFNRTVNSLVIGLTLGRQKMATLGENIVFKYTPLQSGFQDPECVFWDFEDTLDWSSRGCRKIPSSVSDQDGEITCSCDHLTNFAVLMDIYYERVEALRIISIIGCAISIVCLVIILITYLSNKNLHVHQSQKIFMCLCGTLLGLYLTFLIMSALDRHPDYPEVTPVPCGILAALVHFFTLSSMAWMGVEGINTYLIVVRVFDAYIPRFMLKASIVAWGVSGLIVLLTGLASQGNYAATDYCFLQKWPSVGGLLIPIAIILLANIVIFSLVVRRLIKSANVASNSDAAGTNRKASIERIKNAVSVLLLLGLTWVTGYLTLIDTTSQVTQTLFIVFNSLQGFFIFILYCARNPVVRAYWAKVCGCGQDSSRTSTRANQGTSQGISLTKTKSTSENDHDYENPSFDDNKEYTDLDFSQGKKSGDPTKPTSSGKEYTDLDFSKIEKGGDPTKSFDGKEDVDPAYEVCII